MKKELAHSHPKEPFKNLPAISPWFWLALLASNTIDVTRLGWHAGLVTLGLGVQLVLYEQLRSSQTLIWPWYKKVGSIILAFFGLALMIFGFWF